MGPDRKFERVDAIYLACAGAYFAISIIAFSIV